MDSEWKVIYYTTNQDLNLLEGDIDISDITTDICIAVHGPGRSNRNFTQDPYFKVGNGPTLQKSTKTARICLFRPEYVIHNNEKWNMTAADKKLLMKVLQTKHHGNKTVWEDITFETGKVSTQYGNINMDILNAINNAPMPDYMDLYYVVNGVRKEKI